MAFVAVLPAAGSILTGLGAAASSIPLIGGALGSIGGGLGGALTSLGAGNILGAASSLGSGVLGLGTNLYTGADKLLGGFLPNIMGAGITPAQGFLGHGGEALFGQQGLGLIGGPGQLFGTAADAAGGMGQLYGVNPFDTVDPNPFVAQNAMDTMAKNELIAGGFLPGKMSIVDKGKALLGGIKDKVDPVLQPVTKTGVAIGKGMDIYNQLTGKGQPPAGGTTTPAQAAQIGQYNRFVPTSKSFQQVVPVNVGAASGAAVPTATPAMQGAGAPQAYVPMPMLNMEDRVNAEEEEAERFKELLAGNANFLSGVAGRMNA